METWFDWLVKKKKTSACLNSNSEAHVHTIKAVHLCYLSAFMVST